MTDPITKVLTPARRALRTLIICIGVAIPVIPAASALFNIDAELTAKVTGLALALVAAATAALNALDGKGGGDSPFLGVAVVPPTHTVPDVE